MTEFLNDWGLILTIFLPLAGALVMMAIPKESEGDHQGGRAGHVAASPPLVGVLLLIDFDYGEAARPAVRRRPPVDRADQRRFILGLDGLSLPLLALTLGIVPLVIIYSWDHIP